MWASGGYLESDDDGRPLPRPRCRPTLGHYRFRLENRPVADVIRSSALEPYEIIVATA